VKLWFKFVILDHFFRVLVFTFFFLEVDFWSSCVSGQSRRLRRLVIEFLDKVGDSVNLSGVEKSLELD
jgi:hypothetical protein